MCLQSWRRAALTPHPGPGTPSQSLNQQDGLEKPTQLSTCQNRPSLWQLRISNQALHGPFQKQNSLPLGRGASLQGQPENTAGMYS